MNTTDPIRKNNVTVSGSTDAKRTMVFGHGFGTDQTIWSAVAEHFERDFRIVRYDNVGAGGSDQASFNPLIYSGLHAYAKDLLDICAALNIENTIMVGHSASAMAAVLAANARPQTFSRLVLIGASPCYRNIGSYRGGFDQDDLDALYETMQTNYQAWVSGFAPLAMLNADRPQLTMALRLRCEVYAQTSPSPSCEPSSNRTIGVMWPDSVNQP